MKLALLSEYNLVNLNVKEISVTLIDENEMSYTLIQYINHGDMWFVYETKSVYNKRYMSGTDTILNTDKMLNELKTLVTNENFNSITLK